MADVKHQPQPGDLIEIDKTPFHHWALYMGDGYVIHLMPLDTGEPSIFITKGKVMKELLKEVVGDREWCVNNKPHCSRQPRPLKEILEKAEQLIDKVVPYDVVTRNCEHFVTELRYGEAFSDQVKKVVLAAVGALGVICGTLLTIFSSKKKKNK
ncbi:phospholipase A and acyltransferase 1-like [Oenanthe melanoleuca]|uniref:phospholipase A and acyltransferase 1-like n=1 Tax=Oenanthe melanoleuca TaxID=2939378 RepID=UPI0024C16247|nr:phospholipase A and acyltransferase 1-like [Oenanthe melanoleuca]